MEEGSVRGATQGEATVSGQNDLPLLTEEKFDFDLSLSSSSANEDDEVFFGPVGHRERCVAAGLELQGLVPAESPPWSPLVGEQFQEIFREAHLLALQIKSSSKKAAPRAPEPGPGEDFVQEARLKLDIFERGLQARRSPLALKRETYCVPTPEAGPVRAALSFAESPGAPEPAPDARLQSQGVAEKGAASRLQPPRPSSALGKGAPAKPQPGREAAPPRPPATGSRASSGAGPSDQSGSAPGLPAPSKFGARRILLKPPGPPRALPGRTSSSGSSSLGTPARGKAAKLSEAFGRLPDTPRPKPSGGNASCPKQSQAAPCAAPRARESASVSLKQSQTPQTGIRRPSSLPSLLQLPKPRGPSSGAKAGPPASNPPQAAVPSAGDSLDTVTPRGQGLSRRPSRSSFGSSAPRATPARCSSVRALQPPTLSTRTPLSVRRLSALPTPSGRRVSALPVWPTPRTGPRATSSPRPRAARPPSRGPPRKAESRPKQAQEASRPGACPTLDSPGLAPLALSFASPEQMVPETPKPEAPKLETPRPEAPRLETPRPETLRLEAPKPEAPKPEAMEQREAAEQQEATPAPSEAVLVHIGAPACPAPAPPPPCRPLIDFSDSPEAGPRRLPLTPLPAGKGQLLIDLFHSPGGPSKPLPVTGQLIDLSSPLICLSPLEEDKENQDSLLLKF